MPILIFTARLLAGFLQAMVLVVLTLALTGRRKSISRRRIIAVAALLTFANVASAFCLLEVLKAPEAFFTAFMIGVFVFFSTWLIKVQAVQALIVLAPFLLLDGALRVCIWSLALTFSVPLFRLFPVSEVTTLCVTALLARHVGARNISWLAGLRFQVADILPSLALMVFAAVVVLSTKNTASLHAGLQIVTFVAAAMIFAVYFLKTRSYSVATHQIEEQELQLANIRSLVANLRRQRHDFANHLNAIYGAAQVRRLDSLDAIARYLEELDFRLRPTPSIEGIGDPVIAGLLAVKTAAAIEHKVAFILDGADELTRIPLEKHEIATVLGNLIDNALESLTEVEGDRRLWVTVKHTDEEVLLRVANNGPPISAPERIFATGYTTKNVDGHYGQGLKIVRDVVLRHRGRIEVRSQAGETVFALALPAAG